MLSRLATRGERRVANDVLYVRFPHRYWDGENYSESAHWLGGKPRDGVYVRVFNLDAKRRFFQTILIRYQLQLGAKRRFFPMDEYPPGFDN